MAVEKQVGIVVTGKDQTASKVLKKVGEDGAKSMGKLKDTVKAMPEQFGKMSGALLLFQSGMGQTSGKVADAANKVSALVGLVAVGGPLGIAIAGVTALVAGASTAWEIYTAETRAAEAAQKSIDAALRESGKRLLEVKERIKDLSDEIRFYGQTSMETAIQKQREMIAANEAGVAAISAEIEAIEWTTRAYYKQDSAEMKHLENLIQIRKNAQAMLAARREELAKMDELHAKQKKENDQRERAERIAKRKAAAEKRAAEAARETAKAEREAAEAERQRQEAIRKSIALINERYSLEARIERGIMEVRMANLQRVADAEAKEMAVRQEMLSRYTDATSQAFGMLTNTLTDFQATASEKFVSLLQGSLQMAGKLVADYIRSVVLANAAKGASEAASQSMSIPGIGMAIAPAAAAAAFSLIAALVSKIPAFETGGVIERTGLATVHAKERVVDAEHTKKLHDWLDRTSTQGGGAAQTTNVNLTVVAQITNPEEMTDAQIKRYLVRISKQAEELVRDGLFLRNVQTRA